MRWCFGPIPKRWCTQYSVADTEGLGIGLSDKKPCDTHIFTCSFLFDPLLHPAGSRVPEDPAGELFQESILGPSRPPFARGAATTAG